MGNGHVGSTWPRGMVVLMSVMTPGCGATVLDVVVVVDVVVDVVVVETGTDVEAVGSPGTEVAVGALVGTVISVGQSTWGRYKRIGVREFGGA
ncbi:MAG: hypothetical protein ACO3AT_10155, partial [Ilumatobacteraceae bacterium]